MTGAWISALGLLIQSVAMVYGGVMGIVLMRSRWRWVPLALIVLYIVACVIWPPLPLRVLSGIEKAGPHAFTDSLRYLLLVLALMAGELVLSLAGLSWRREANRRERQLRRGES